ncbi:MAG: hypothetical protein K2I75_03555, partial [Clostridiales bacterium]|nr:hypothetical protein [Clostridiales bacterium]
MKKFKTLFISILAIVVLALCVACGGGGDNSSNGTKNFVDYASTVKLDFDSNTKKQEVTVRLYVDG